MSLLVNRNLLLHMLQQGEPVRAAANRGVGKTTGAILQALGESCSRPGEWLDIRDPDNSTAAMRTHTIVHVRRVTDTLGLQEIEVRIAVAPYRVQIRNTFAERLA